jgi:hypothetical protein
MAQPCPSSWESSRAVRRSPAAPRHQATASELARNRSPQPAAMAASTPTTRPSRGTSRLARIPPPTPMPRVTTTRQGRVLVQAAHASPHPYRHHRPARTGAGQLRLDSAQGWSHRAQMRGGVATVKISTNLRSFLPVVIALSIMLAGCTRDRPFPSVTATTAAPAATPPPPPAELCGGPTTPAQSLWLSAPGGAQIYAAVVGTGPTTAVFVHQAGPTGLCGFWPYAAWLARTNGVRSMLFSQCGALELTEMVDTSGLQLRRRPRDRAGADPSRQAAPGSASSC